MRLLFNLHAIIQLLAGVLILVLIQMVASTLDFEYNVMGGEMEQLVSLQFLILASAFLDVKGFKGTLFFIPTWITLILVSIFFMVVKNFHNQFIFYIYFIVIIGAYLLLNKRELKKIWAYKKSNLELLNVKLKNGSVAPKEFWALASKIYFKPSKLFLYFNVIWSLIYRNVINGDEFLKFYRNFIDKIELYDLDKERHERWISELRLSLDYDEQMKYYSHRPGSLNRLGELINHQNKILTKTAKI